MTFLIFKDIINAATTDITSFNIKGRDAIIKASITPVPVMNLNCKIPIIWQTTKPIIPIKILKYLLNLSGEIPQKRAIHRNPIINPPVADVIC